MCDLLVPKLHQSGVWKLQPPLGCAGRDAEDTVCAGTPGPREGRSPPLLPSRPPRPTSGGQRKERAVPAERAWGAGSSEADASFPFSLRHGVSPEETLGGTFINTDHTVFRGLWQAELS